MLLGKVKGSKNRGEALWSLFRVLGGHVCGEPKNLRLRHFQQLSSGPGFSTLPAPSFLRGLGGVPFDSLGEVEWVPAPKEFCACALFLQQARTLLFSLTALHLESLPSRPPLPIGFCKYALAVLSFPSPPPPLLQSIVTRGPSGVRALCSGCELGLFGGSRTPWMNGGVCVCVCVCKGDRQTETVPILSSSYPHFSKVGYLYHVIPKADSWFRSFIELWLGSVRAESAFSNLTLNMLTVQSFSLLLQPPVNNLWTSPSFLRSFQLETCCISE